MLRFSDTPYVFHEARPNALVYRCSMWLNRRMTLPGKTHRIASLDVSGLEALKALNKDPGVRLIFVANHSTHSDVETLAEALRRAGIWGSFMAAREVFARSRIQAWVMQRVAAFSVDRERVDRRSLKEAVRMVRNKRFCLVLFPEGNVAFTNEHAMSFLDGAAFIGAKAQRELKDTAKVYFIPTSIRLTHTRDVRDTLRQQLRTLIEALAAEGMEVPLDEARPFHLQLEAVGHAILGRGLKLMGWEAPIDLQAWREDPDGSLKSIAHEVLAKLEGEMGVEGQGPVADRSRVLRSQLAKLRLEEGQDPAQLRRWDDQSILLLRVQSYRADYLRTCPSVDRCSETLEKLREDFSNVLVRPVSPRHAHLHFGEAIALNGKGSSDFTQELQAAVNQGLARYQSPFVGAEMMDGNEE